MLREASRTSHAPAGELRSRKTRGRTSGRTATIVARSEIATRRESGGRGALGRARDELGAGGLARALERGLALARVGGEDGELGAVLVDDAVDAGLSR